ncbi:MAG TPA: helix-turn-helix transcriptional regulator [Dermatophilaceae bacterium]|nr:helix-turn-helix transcriptional regulator [Dermatophilaceae bacterium]
MTRLQDARAARGWSQARLIHELEVRARNAGVTVASRPSLKPLVSRWENGHSKPDATYRRLLREIYGLSDVDLGLTAERAEGQQPVAVELGARLATSAVVDAQLIALLQSHIDNIRLMDRRLGAPVLLEQLRGHITTTSDLLAHSVRQAHRRPLAAVLSDAASLAGWQALDVGAPQEAWTHFETAKAAAREAHSPALLAHAMGEQSFALLDLDKADLAFDLLDQAHAVARYGVPALLEAWLCAAKGEACAAAGDGEGSSRAFGTAHRLLPEPTTDPELPFIALDRTHLMRWQGCALARLGDSQAPACLSAALVKMPLDFVRAQAGLYVNLAIALRRQGAESDAREHAHRGHRLALQAGSVRQQQRLRNLCLVA